MKSTRQWDLEHEKIRLTIFHQLLAHSLCLQDGSVFQGSLKDGRPNGFGTVTYADTDPKQRVRFAGEFEEGIRRGMGCLVWKDGAQYAGVCL